MDPLQVATVVAGLTGTCLKTAMTLDGLRATFPGAGSIISTLCRECASVSASLTDIQSSVLQGFESQPELDSAFDTAVIGCLVMFTCLEQDINRTTSPPSEHTSNSRTPWRMKNKNELSEAQLSVYLSRIQDQKAAMAVLVQLLKMKGLSQITTEVQKHHDLFQRIEVSTKSLRVENSDINVRESLFNTTALTKAVERPEGSRVKRDKSIIDTRSYQRNQALLQIKATLAPVTHITAPPEGDLIDLSDDMASPTSGSARLSPLESMWNLDAVLPASPKTHPPLETPFISADAPFHTVRGPSSRDQVRSHKRSSRSTSRRADRTPTEVEDSATASTSNISSQPSLPLSIKPKLIHFIAPCEHEQAKSLPFRNTNPFPITYKVSTTRPTSYAVRPNFGTLLPDQTIDVQFILMEALAGSEEELKRRDKFRIQSVPVEDVAHGSMFDWKADKAGAKIEEVKIKVEIVLGDEGASSEKAT